MESRLRRLGGTADAEIDIAQAALLLAALERPQVSLDRYNHHLSLLERDTAALAARQGAAEDLTARIAVLNQVLVERYSYQGDRESYEDLRNANLMRVIDRRRGLPVALGILYLHAARSQGWSIDGLNFPGHFLLRLDLAGERAIIDPFNSGRICDAAALRGLVKTLAGAEAELRPEHTDRVGNRDVLLRLQNNIKLRLIRQERSGDALEVIETMLMFAPDRPALWKEAGILHAHLDNMRAAIMAFEHYLELAGPEPDRQSIADLLHQLRNQLN
ncbi:tetratricopeptide repeat protein [Pelagibius litoralis]|uniref:Tetratricopeptide repeat protein n=1 Tax=Pelagibius litoralis TaxID=374515 RepID=A0A967F2Q3_9PROT|nr:tetratricopeptide repeat protein [Pelagibius litoralis]